MTGDFMHGQVEQARTVEDFAHGAAYIHEISGGRFRFGIGVAHGPSHIRMGVTPGKPLGDTRAFVEKFRSYDGIGALPPIVLAAGPQSVEGAGSSPSEHAASDSRTSSARAAPRRGMGPA